MRFLTIFLLSCLLIPTCHAQQTHDLPFTKGVYGNARVLLEKGYSFKSLGINAIFVGRTSLNDTLYKAAKEQGVRVYVEFPTLNGKEYLNDHPEAWPINEKGERAAPADWFMGICLTDSGFRKFRTEQLKSLLEKFSVDGIWLDYLHWHAQFESPDPILPETCFCERCIRQFEMDMVIQVPEGDVVKKAQWILSRSDTQWRLWRSQVLNGWVSDLKTVVKDIRSDALLGIYYCPWYPSDFNEALYRILGVDLKALTRIADVFSPMLYHERMGRSPAWVGEYTAWLAKAGIYKDKRPLIWPIVQAHNIPGVIPPAEFRQVLHEGSQFPSTGIMMFTVHSLVDESEKLDVMKAFYLQK